MKNILLLVTVFFAISCSKDAYEETNNSQRHYKQKPNLKLNFLSTKENPQSLEPIFRQYAKKIKREQNPNARGEILSTLEGDFGVVKLDRVLEVNEGTYKTESFEVDEAIKDPNIYYNLIIDKNENIWLYKIEKLTQAKNNYPANSELVTRMELDVNLNMSTPCDTIVYPPFGYYTPETIPNSGSGGAIPGGWFNNPSPGTGGIITGGFFNSGSGIGSSGSSSIGRSGSSSGVVELVTAIGEAFVGAWNWLIELFTGEPEPGENKPCDCKNKRIVVIDDVVSPCGDLGYIAIIAQDDYVDKILNFQNYFTVLHNNDNVFLYENHAIVDYIDNSIAQHPTNSELHNLFPEIISGVRLNKMTWSFGISLINYIIQNPAITFNYLMNNKTSFNNYGEIDNYNTGNYDNTIYPDFNALQNWSNIPSVIPINKFVGWNVRAHPTWQCMQYSKEQLKVVGYQISSYYSTGQTFQIYTTQNGVNTSQLSQGLSYLKSALSRGIPVIVGVDDAPGHTGNLDNTTDHFIVIVGMGHNTNGNYFQFYDNASSNASQGASPLNLLYYNSTTGKISGSSQTSYGQGQPYPYILTMIRKSKLL